MIKHALATAAVSAAILAGSMAITPPAHAADVGTRVEVNVFTLDFEVELMGTLFR